MLHKPTYLFCILALAMPVSCSQEADMAGAGNCDVQTEEAQRVIGFTLTDPESMTRGKDVLNSTNIIDQKFGLFAAYTEGEERFGATTPVNSYLYNTQFGTSDGTLWHGEPTKVYWPLGDYRLSFFAYAPYDASLSQLNMQSGNVGTYTMDYQPDPVHYERQLDLCLAKPVLNKQYVPGEVYTMEFKHCTTFVRYYAKYQGSLSARNDVVIDEVKLNNILKRRRLSFDIDPSHPLPYQWSETVSSAPDDYTSYDLTRLTSTRYLVNDKLLNTSFINIQINNGNLFLVPQTLHGASLEVAFSYVRNDIANADGTKIVTGQFTRTFDLPDDLEFKPGRYLSFYITIDVEGSVVKLVSKDDGEVPGIVQWQNAGNHGSNTDDEQRIM